MEAYLVAIGSLNIDTNKNFKKKREKMDRKTLQHCASEKFGGMCPRKSLAHIINRTLSQPPRSTKSLCEVIEKYIYLYILSFKKVEE